MDHRLREKTIPVKTPGSTCMVAIYNILYAERMNRHIRYYLSDNTIQGETSVSYCKDVLLNATLSSYFGQAKKAGITLETHLAFPDTLPVDSGEFSIAIANAMENAINACCSFPEEQRIITCRCIYKPQLMLEISNPCSNDIVFSKDGIPLSKEQEHGIGTRSILAFCKKYDAFCSFSIENNLFILKVVL